MQNSKTVAQTLLGETAHFGLFPPKISFFRGVGGGSPKFYFSLESSSFCYLGAHAKIQNPSYLLSGRKATAFEREIMASTIVTTSAQRRSDQFLNWKVHNLLFVCQYKVLSFF